jgi:hypothetical protein
LLPPSISMAAKSGYCRSSGMDTPTQCHHNDFETLVSAEINPI